MANLFSYLRKYKNIELKKENFSIIDALVLTGIVYLPLPKFPSLSLKRKDSIGCLLQKFSEHPTAYRACVMPNTDLRFARTLIDCSRFNKIKMYAYLESIDKIKQKQFRAVTFVNEELNNVFVSYCGTDTTLVGWKEDLNLSFQKQTPSQEEAVVYLKNIAEKFPNYDIFIGGHSKGGNLAMYAATFIDETIQKRIKYIFNFDGPGFLQEVINTENYQNIRSKIITIVPNYSVVGVLFEHSDKFRIIKSNGIGVYNHSFYYWSVDVNKKDFIYCKRISKLSVKTSIAVRTAMKKLTPQERENFTGNVYTLFTAGGAKTTRAISKDVLTALKGASNAFDNMGKEEQDATIDVFYRWISCYFKPLTEEEEKAKDDIEERANRR